MSEEDITILDDVILRHVKTRKGMRSVTTRLYYYQGNFFFAVSLIKKQQDRVRRAMRRFMRENKELVEADRAHPDYRPFSELLEDLADG